jgi:hypothetical protein
MGFAPPDDPVAKGPVTRCLDELSVDNDARRKLTALRQALIGLQGSGFDGLERVFAEHLFRPYYPQDQVDALTAYLKTNWFSPETGWWSHYQPIAPIYALGLIQALNLSLEPKGPPRPIDSYWIIGHGHVELINLVSGRQVTLLIATPAPGALAPAGIQGAASQVWVTARRSGRTEEEINPVTEQVSPGGADLRVRTYKIQSRAQGRR